MKRVIFINGTMGIGKTTTSKHLQKMLDNSVFLDGDWCWDMHPFIVNEETKTMVIDNIQYLLNNFIRCSEYENIVFCWVMHEQKIIDEILSELNMKNCEFHIFTLISELEALKVRLYKDIEKGIRSDDVVQRTMERAVCYDALTTIKIDVTQISAGEAAQEIMHWLMKKNG